MEDKLLVTGQEGQRDGRRRLIGGCRCQIWALEIRRRPQARIAGGNLIERTDDGGRVSRLKCVDVWALMHYHRLAVHQCKCQDHPKITLRNVGSRIVVVSIHIVDVPGDRGELNNPWTGGGGSHEQEPMDGQHQDP